MTENSGIPPSLLFLEISWCSNTREHSEIPLFLKISKIHLKWVPSILIKVKKKRALRIYLAMELGSSTWRSQVWPLSPRLSASDYFCAIIKGIRTNLVVRPRYLRNLRKGEKKNRNLLSYAYLNQFLALNRQSISSIIQKT